jgi:hypothetical protein
MIEIMIEIGMMIEDFCAYVIHLEDEREFYSNWD